MLGIWGLIEGIVLLVMAFKADGWPAGILGGLAILFGLILIATYAIPGAGLAMRWTASVVAVVAGVIMVVQAFRQRRA